MGQLMMAGRILLALLLLVGNAVAGELSEFTSDGCTLFPDGTLGERALWCECCLAHDMAYWQGGDAQDRERADQDLRECVRDRTGDAALADTMYAGVRVGGHPAFPTWYRWSYGWPYGRGYEPLTEPEKGLAREKIERYRAAHPEGYCRERNPDLPDVRERPPASAAKDRPERWARPIATEGVPNLHKINDRLYRSAQPTALGMKNLEKLGIRRVINLRVFHSDTDEVAGTSLLNDELSVKAWHIEDEDVVRVLQIVTREGDGPFLIHCLHGADRTGVMSAMYRIVVEGWTKDEAIAEMVEGGYGFHSIWTNIISYVQNVDVEAIRKAAGF